MFTGIIEGIGTVTTLSRRSRGGRVEVEAGPLADGLRLGDSIAVDGACLTVAVLRGGRFAADISPESLRRTTLGRLRSGSRVNLERPVRPEDRLGGHLVTGHVDAVGEVAARIPQGVGELWRFRAPRGLGGLLVAKGAVAVDGISLTVAAVAADTFEIALIPFTLRHTTLPGKRTGAAVNLETDLVGKYVARLAAGHDAAGRDGGITLAMLQEHGYA